MPQQSYQDALLAELQRVAENLGTSTLVHKDYSNTGTIIAGTPFEQYAHLRFDVQPRKVQILFNGSKLGPTDMSFYFDVTDTTQAKEMLNKWRSLVTEGKAKPI